MVPVLCNKGHPLLIVELLGCLTSRVLSIVYLYALGLHHDKPRVYALDLGHELFLTDRSCLGLLNHQGSTRKARILVGGGIRGGMTCSLVLLLLLQLQLGSGSHQSL